MRPQIAPSRRDLAAAIVLSLACLACWGRLVVQPGALVVDADRPGVDRARKHDSALIGNDLTRLFLPKQEQVSRQVAEFGQPSGWDESGFGGRPAVGNPQAGLFYPPAWVARLSRSPATLGWLTVAHLAWAGLGTYALMRRLGCRRLASLLAAGCVQSSPYVVAQAYEGHLPHVWAASWAPWTFLGVLGLSSGASWLAALMPIGLAMSYLAGHPQEWYYLTIALLAWAAYDTWFAGQSVGRKFQRGLRWACSFGLSLGLIAVSFVPEMAAAGWTLKSARLSLRHAGQYHIDLQNLLQLLGPRALGGPADYVGETNAWETLLSIGLVPLVLALLSAAAPRRFQGKVRGWACLLLVAVLFACGRSLGLFALMYELVPGMDRFRVPARSLFLASLAASILAGFGVEAVLAGRWRRGRLARLGGRWPFALGIVVVAGAGIPLIFPPALRWSGPLLRLAGDPVFWLGLIGSALALMGAKHIPRRRELAAVALTALALVELSADGLAWGRVSAASRFLGEDPIGDVIRRASRTQDGPFRIRAADTIYPDLLAFSRGFHKSDLYDSFQIQHAADLYSTLYPLFRDEPAPLLQQPMGEALAEYRRQVRQGVLDRMAVAFLVAPAESRGDWPVVGEGIAGGRPFVVHRNESALPRAYVVPRSQTYSGDPVEALSLFRRIEARESVLMLEGDDPLGDRPGPRQVFRPATWASTNPDRTVLRVSTDAPGLLVVADTWMPGWTATVNGRPAPILRGNHAQRVIPLPVAGTQEIILAYQPPGLLLGESITVASLMILAMSAFRLTPGSSRTARWISECLRLDPAHAWLGGSGTIAASDEAPVRPSRAASAGTTRSSAG